MSKFTKRAATIAVAAVALSGVGVAYAYWTTTGTGTGEASARGVAATGETIVLTQNTAITGLYPDAPAQDIMVKATNPAPYDQEVGDVTVAVTSYPAGCGSSNWVLEQVATAEFGLLQAANAGNDDEAVAKVGTFRLIDTGLNQDACKLGVPAFSFTSAPGATDDRSPVAP